MSEIRPLLIQLPLVVIFDPKSESSTVRWIKVVNSWPLREQWRVRLEQLSLILSKTMTRAYQRMKYHLLCSTFFTSFILMCSCDCSENEHPLSMFIDRLHFNIFLFNLVFLSKNILDHFLNILSHQIFSMKNKLIQFYIRLFYVQFKNFNGNSKTPLNEKEIILN